MANQPPVTTAVVPDASNFPQGEGVRNVTANDVKCIMGLEIQKLPDDKIEPFITTAHLLVEEDLVNKGLSNVRLREIKKYLAAHFAVLGIEGGGIIEQELGDTTERYRPASWDDRGLLATRFGQQAVALDTSGTLAENANSTRKAEFRVVGRAW